MFGIEAGVPKMRVLNSNWSVVESIPTKQVHGPTSRVVEVMTEDGNPVFVERALAVSKIGFTRPQLRHKGRTTKRPPMKSDLAMVFFISDIAPRGLWVVRKRISGFVKEISVDTDGDRAPAATSITQ